MPTKSATLFGHCLWILALTLAVGCGTSAEPQQPASGSGGSNTSAGASGVTAGAGAAALPSGGGAVSAGGGSGAAGGVSVGGSSGGAAPIAGATSAGGTSVVPFPDPGTEGDGDFMLTAPYKSSALNNPSGAPVGKQIMFTMASADSTIYPGRTGPYSRKVWVYVPSQYKPGQKAPFLVIQDGYFALWFGNDLPHNPNPNGPNLPGTANVPLIVDNLVSQGKLPPLVVLFVDNGGGDAEGSQRGLEYDTVSGKYAEFIQTEVLPRAQTEVKTQLQIELTFTDDPRGRATLGGSSGGAAAFSMAWWHPDFFTRVISYSGTFVRQASPDDPKYPHGCWSYHDYDPFDATTPNGLIMKEPTPKPIRVWLEVGGNDSGAGSGPGSYRDFKLANQRMAASLKAQKYHYHFDFAPGAGHVDGNVVAQTLPDALLWLWRDYPL
jgi:enterochelin esterase family protein